jgi:hypothetical protein
MVYNVINITLPDLQGLLFVFPRMSSQHPYTTMQLLVPCTQGFVPRSPDNIRAGSHTAANTYIPCTD